MKAILIFWQSSTIAWAKYYLYLRKLKEREVWKFDQGHVCNMRWERNWNSCLWFAHCRFSYFHSASCTKLRFLRGRGEAWNSESVVRRGWPQQQVLGEHLSSNSMRGVMQRRQEAGSREKSGGERTPPAAPNPQREKLLPWMESKSKIPELPWHLNEWGDCERERSKNGARVAGRRRRGAQVWGVGRKNDGLGFR